MEVFCWRHNNKVYEAGRIDRMRQVKINKRYSPATEYIRYIYTPIQKLPENYDFTIQNLF